MKKKFLILCILLLAIINIYSQNNAEREYFSFTVGPSFPLGGYAKKDFKNVASGFAKTGGNVNISYYRLMGKKTGITATLLGQINPLNASAIAQAFDQSPFNSFSFGSQPGQPVPSNGTIYPNWHVDNSSWKIAALMFGGYGEFNSGNGSKISFFTRALIGALYASSPSLKASSITDTAAAYLTQSSGSAVGFSFLLGAGIKYKLTSRISLLSGIEYLGTTKLTFKNIKAVVTTTKGREGTIEHTISQGFTNGNATQSFNALNLNFGIGLNLN